MKGVGRQGDGISAGGKMRQYNIRNIKQDKTSCHRLVVVACLALPSFCSALEGGKFFKFCILAVDPPPVLCAYCIRSHSAR